MVKSIDAVLSRGERIEILVDRTDEMSQQARAFRKRSTVLRSVEVVLTSLSCNVTDVKVDPVDRRKMWWKNIKVLMAIGFSAIVRGNFSSASHFECQAKVESVGVQLLFYLLVASACGLNLHSCSS